MNTNDKYILWLSVFEGLSSVKKFDLYKYFKSAKAVYEADLPQLLSAGVLTDYSGRKLIEYKKNNEVKNIMDKCSKEGIEFISIENKKYPRRLLNISDPPLGLFVIGEMPGEDMINAAIVGSRACTNYGASQAYKFANHFALNGVAIISGLAKGIDAKAHLGALDAQGSTIAVLGSGVDIGYPAENAEIRKRILETGCIISEFAPGAAPLRSHFPVRNRIISGLSDAVCVIEATKNSGSLITVNHALEQGREVFSVPGNITSALSQGCNDLLKSGAHPLTEPFDLYEVMSIDVKRDDSKADGKAKNAKKSKTTKSNKNSANPTNSTNSESAANVKTAENTKSDKSGKPAEKVKADNSNYEEKKKKVIESLAANEKMVYDCIGFEPITVEELTAMTNSQVQTVQYILTILEINSCIKKLPGQKYVRSL